MFHDKNWVARLFLGFVIVLLGGCNMSGDKTSLSHLQQANALVKMIGRDFGIRDARLDATNDCSFGECGFHFDDTSATLTIRVFIRDAFLQDAPPEERENTKKCYAALDDPKIGGMFEQGGGRFVVDEAKNALFLTKSHALDTISADEFKTDVEYLLELGAKWSLDWLMRVASVVHGWEPAPLEPVTLASERKKR